MRPVDATVSNFNHRLKQPRRKFMLGWLQARSHVYDRRHLHDVLNLIEELPMQAHAAVREGAVSVAVILSFAEYDGDTLSVFAYQKCRKYSAINTD